MSTLVQVFDSEFVFDSSWCGYLVTEKKNKEKEYLSEAPELLTQVEIPFNC